MTKQLSDYMMDTGYYNEAAIMEDAGMSKRAALFADIFGGTGDSNTVDDLPAPFQQMLDEARAYNAAKLAVECKTIPPFKSTTFESEWVERGSATGE